MESKKKNGLVICRPRESALGRVEEGEGGGQPADGEPHEELESSLKSDHGLLLLAAAGKFEASERPRSLPSSAQTRVRGSKTK